MLELTATGENPAVHFHEEFNLNFIIVSLYLINHVKANSSQVPIGNINREINYTMTKPIELFNTMFFFVTIGFLGISLSWLITLRWFLVS